MTQMTGEQARTPQEQIIDVPSNKKYENRIGGHGGISLIEA